MTTTNAPLFIVGGGALGLRFALQCKSARPTLVLRDSPSDSIVVRSVDHADAQLDEAEIATRALSSITEFPENSFILMCTKVHALRDVLEKLKPRLLGTETVVLCQNGLGVGEMAAQVIVRRNMVRLMARFGAFRTSPGIIRPSGPVAVTIAGFPNDARSMSRAEELKVNFLALGIEVSAAVSPIAAEWNKTTVNIITNSIATILNSPNGIVLDDQEVWKLALSVLKECKAVSETDGVTLGDDFTPEELRSQIERYRENTNSTLVDLRAGRISELPWLIGAMVSRAERAGIPVPVSKTLNVLLEGLERSSALARR